MKKTQIMTWDKLLVNLFDLVFLQIIQM